MKYTVDELLWLFFLYSFAGWVLETVFAAFKQKRFVNKGLINGPVCILYGIAGAIFAVALQDLNGIWRFFGAMINASIIEWIAGLLIEKVYHERWWDYSEVRWNLGGYICLRASVVWGCLGFITVTWLDRLLTRIFRVLPHMLGQGLVWAMVGVLLLDNVASYILLTGRSGRLDRWEKANNQIANVSARLGKWIAERIEQRLRRAYPTARKTEEVDRDREIFAEGCGFYKLTALFFLSAFLGDIVETVFCRITMGWWMSRSSVIWGPFSIVWGIAVAAATALLYRYRERGEAFLFFSGTLIGGTFEYLCSVFTEVAFGKVFWDYSGHPFNLGGRINLLFCFFWGFAAVIWFKLLYPAAERWIEKIPVRIGKMITWIMVVFMTLNIVMTSLALVRYDQRGNGEDASASWQVWMDEHYGDEQMERIYPKAKPASELKENVLRYERQESGE